MTALPNSERSKAFGSTAPRFDRARNARLLATGNTRIGCLVFGTAMRMAMTPTPPESDDSLPEDTFSEGAATVFSSELSRRMTLGALVGFAATPARATPRDEASGQGSNPVSAGQAVETGTPMYKPSIGLLRGIGDKLDEHRSILDAIPDARKPAITDGTSTWPAEDTINRFIKDVGGRAIDFTGAHCIAIGAPIDLVRGTFLRSRDSFDTVKGRASKIFILNGANCAAIRTPSAVDGSPATHYCGLEWILIDGNAEHQTKSTPGGIVQWYGQYIGSMIHGLFIDSPRGPGLVIGAGPDSPAAANGADIEMRHVWINGAVLDEGEYALDSNMNCYADSPHGDLSAVRSGLPVMDYIFVENPKSVAHGDPRNVLEDRSRNAIRLHGLQSLLIGKLHMEGAVYGCTISACQVVSILSPSGAWIGKEDVSDSALFSLMKDNQVISIGPPNCISGTPRATTPGVPVKLRRPYKSDYFYEVPAPYPGNVASGAYFAARASIRPQNIGRARATNLFEVVRWGAQEAASIHIGNTLGSMARYGFITQQGNQLQIGSNNQPKSEKKTFIAITSAGDEGDSVSLLEPVILATRNTPDGMKEGALAWVGPSSKSRRMIAINPDKTNAEVVTLRRGGGSPVGTVKSRYEGELYWDAEAKKMYVSSSENGTKWLALNN